MAEFIPFDPNVEVIGRTINIHYNNLLFNKFPVFKDSMRELVQRFFKVDEINPDEWYPQKKLLDMLKYIYENIGTNTLFLLGKAVLYNTIFPNINTLEEALNGLNTAYHLNHRNGEIGYYKLIDYDYSHRIAVMECKNPYPDEFDRGILIELLRKFLPEKSIEHDVEIDTSKPTRRKGAESTFYIVKW